jgi:hypothetical protein
MAKAKLHVQDEVHRQVEKIVTQTLKGRGPQSEVEWAFVRAVYNPDRRMR